MAARGAGRGLNRNYPLTLLLNRCHSTEGPSATTIAAGMYSSRSPNQPPEILTRAGPSFARYDAEGPYASASKAVPELNSMALASSRNQTDDIAARI